MSTTDLAYRDVLAGARLRYEDLFASARQATGLAGASRVVAARTARIWAGTVGIIAAVLVAAQAIVIELGHESAPITETLLLAWPAMGLAYLLGAKVGARRADRVALPRPTGNYLEDLARLEGARPTDVARAGAERLEVRSVALPMVAVGLLAPLSIHFFVACVIGSSGRYPDWILMSLAIVGHAHLVLAAMYVRFACRLKKLDTAGIDAARSGLEWSAWGATVGASAVPGVVFLLLPPVLTALTGLLFNPLLCRSMAATLIAERRALS